MRQKEKKKKDITIKQSFANNLYAIKLCFGMSKGRIISTAFDQIMVYVDWIFFMAVFMRLVIGSIEAHKSFEEIMVWVLIVGAAEVAYSIFMMLHNNYIVPTTNVTIYKKLYKKLFKKSANVELRCYEDNEFYNKYTMATDGAGDKITGVITNAFGAFFGFFACIVIFLTMYDIDKVSVLFVIFPIIGNFVFGSMMNKIYMKRYKDMVPAGRKIAYVMRVMHLADFAKELRLSKVFKIIKRDYHDAVKETCDVVDKYTAKGITVFTLQCFFTFTIIFEGVLLYGAYRSLCDPVNPLPLADLAVLTTTMVSATWMLIGFSNNLIECYKNGMFIQNMRDFLDYKEQIPEDADGDKPSEKIDTLEFRNVSFRYVENEPLIDNISFTIRGGESVALVGHNGAGKSTIIKLLLRLYEPTEGEILLNGRNIKEYKLAEYRALFGAAFQDHRVIAMPVIDNVLMGRKVENPREATREALKKAGVLEKIESLPAGIDTILTREFDDDGAVLSGGEYQKVVVARAFATGAPLKVFDEPSSALDPIAECQLFENIMQEAHTSTMIFISHRLSSVKQASQVLMLEKGKIIERGTHRELLAANGAYAYMYNMQARSYLALEDEGVSV